MNVIITVDEPYGLFKGVITAYNNGAWTGNGSSVLSVIFVPLFPVLYLYIWYKIREFLLLTIEIRVDKTDCLPTPEQIKRGTNILVGLSGFPLVVAFLWSCTSQLPELWGHLNNFWWHPGFLAALLIAFSASFFGALMPNSLKKAIRSTVSKFDKNLDD